MRLLRTMLRNCVLHPLGVSVIDDQRRWKRYETLFLAFHIARAIRAASDAPRVGVLLPTSGLFPAAAMGAWIAGRTIVPINYLLSRSDIDYIAKDAGLDACVAVKPMLEHIGGAPEGTRPILLESLRLRGIPPLCIPKGVPDSEVAVLLYTSGTSGRPKGVMLTGDNLCANALQVAGWAQFTRADVMLGVLPQFHSFGLTVLTLLPAMLGCTVVYSARFVPRRILELARAHRATILVAIPSMYNALRSCRDARGDEFRTLRYAVSGGEPLPAAVTEGFLERFGVRISEGYGLTETSPVTNWCRPHEYRAGSVGKPITGVEERLVDGEIRIRGPNVMKGYYNLPEETARAFDEEGWFRTGDIGRFDEDGHLFITGRLKEMLIISGENVFPREIEEVLNRHPAVKESAVIGLPDESRGEVPVAFVELAEGAALDPAEARAFCRESLPPYKVPREIRVLPALPRNPTGKVLRRALPRDAVRG